MADAARERLARMLGESQPSESSSAELLAPAHLLHLEVSNVGRVSLPVRAPMAKKLIAVARPAKFGRGEKTLTDTDVRDTWELTPDQITLDGPGWPALMDRALEHFRDELGLPRTSRLRAEPHAMLVYGKGQFFLPHRDSEKDDAMVGTMVMSLPSAHTGGELVIDHAGERAVHRASKDDLTFVAFYADCLHQVTPVRSGYRLTITFNLLADDETPATKAGSSTELAQCLTEHFTTPATSRYGDRDLGIPNRMVFLLDHEYTQRGLTWRRLKGADADRAALLRTAADQAGCDTVLALAEVKETWDVEPPDDLWDDYGEYDDHDDYDDPDPNDLTLTDLIDDEITLGWWTEPDGTGGESISLYTPNHEVCTATPSVHLTPYESEYEGYMGNYGNTVDRWYRRAAVVVWPRDRAFAARAEAGSLWALTQLRGLIDTGDLKGARVAAESLAPFWPRIGTRADLVGAVLEVAAGLDAAATAAMLLEPFGIQVLDHEHAERLAALARCYGEDWMGRVIDGWFERANRGGADLTEWVDAALPPLCERLRASKGSRVARQLGARTRRWMEDWLRHWTTVESSNFRRPMLELMSSPLTRLLEAADAGLRREITGALRTYEDTVLECVMPALRLPDARQVAGLDKVARDCAKRLEAIAARPLRTEDDWSIQWTGCGCDICDKLATFLGSPSRRELAWPLAKVGRSHLHSKIDLAELPVLHQTRRQGRPFTLMLTKTDELFTRAADAREEALADLAWLRSTWQVPK